MRSNARFAILVLAILITMGLLLGCKTEGHEHPTRRYLITVGPHWSAYCDSYRWDGDDLHMKCCGIECSDPVFYNAANVTIRDKWED